MRILSHPVATELSLPALLHALADPVRLDIVRALAATDELSCADACAAAPVARATLSRHFDVLRSAGVVHTRKDGVSYRNSLRRVELEQRFPGLLEAVLRAASP